MISVSIALVTYNVEKYVDQALDSILMQRIPDDIRVRIVVADDCSTDNTASIIKNRLLGSNIPFVFLNSTENSGITGNYKRIMEQNVCDYLAILEGDDYWASPDYIASTISYLDSHREVSLCVGNYAPFIDKEEYPVIMQSARGYLNEPEFHTLSEMMEKNYVGNLSSCVFRGSSVSHINPKMWTLDVDNVDDWLFGIEMSKYGYVACIPRISTMYRLRSDSFWSSKKEEDKKIEMSHRYHVYHEYIGGDYFRKCIEEEKKERYSKAWLFIINCPHLIIVVLKKTAAFFLSPKRKRSLKRIFKNHS